MITQGEAVRKLQGLIVSGSDSMSRGELILAVIDAPDQLKDVTGDKLAKYTALYEEYMAMDEQEEITAEEAVEITDEAKEKFKSVLREIQDDNDVFNRLIEQIEEFLFNPPFEGLDDQPYGLVEVSLFSYMEYFLCKTRDMDHETLREKYRQSVADRSYEENANVHMEKNYDPLQGHFGRAIGKLTANDDLDVALTVCAMLALTNVKTPEMVSMIIDPSVDQGRELANDVRDDIYVEGENTLHDNAVKLVVFMKGVLEDLDENME